MKKETREYITNPHKIHKDILSLEHFSSLFSNKLTHDFPQGYLSTDSFYKYDRAHYLIESGNFKNTEWYTVDGREDLFQDDSPFAYFLTAIYSLNSGIPDYDSYQFIGIIIKIISVFVMYLFIRKLNEKAAILSLGLSPFIFFKNNFISFHYGWIPITVAASIMVFLFWVLLNRELIFNWLLLGLSIAAAMLSHLSEFIYAALIMAVFLIYTIIKNKFNQTIIKKYLLSVSVALLFAFYFIPSTFINLFAVSSTGGIIGSTVESEPTFPITVLTDFGIFLPILLLGLFIFIYYCIKENEKFEYIIPISLITFISFLPLLKFSDRFYQIRFFWPVFFMIFFGFGTYFLLNLFIKKLKKYKSVIITIMTLIMIVLSIKLYYTPTSPNSLIVNKDMWDGMQWIQNNVPKESSTLIVYGDSYSQYGVYLMFGRLIHEINDDDYINKLNKGIIVNEYVIREFIHGYDYFVRKGLFSFEPVKLGKPEWEQTRGWENTDLCSFDYYVIDKLSRYKEVIDYNLKIRQTLLNSGHFEEVFSNGWYIILKNEKPEEDCIGKQ